MPRFSLIPLALAVLGTVAHAQVTLSPDPPLRGESVTITYDATGRALDGASTVYIHLGWDGWQEVISPDPAMTGGSNVWQYTATVPNDAVQIDCVFNNGAGTWDNNDNSDWHFAVSFDLTGYPLGATSLGSGGVVFRVWAPNATSAVVAGDFNGWSTSASPMVQDEPGIWSVFEPTAEIGDEYKYQLSGSLWRVDPRCRDSVNSTGNSIIRGDGSDYDWQATGWQTPDHEEMVIYELHVGTFSGNGDGVGDYPATFRDVVDAHLDELQALGVNMVELMPIHEFPGGVSWGYNPSNFFAPESNHGTPDDLRYLVDTLHQSGIGVILDVVYNHTSVTDNNLWDFDGPSNIYFFDGCAAETPWGDTRPRYTEAQVRDFITDNARHWIEEYRIDGLRLDATTAMRGYCDEAGEGWLLIGDIADAVHAAHPRAIVIAEELPNNALITTPQGEGGAGCDAQWGDDFGDSFRAQLATIGAGGDPDMGDLAAAIAESGFGRPNEEAVKFVENHDEVGNDVRITELIDSADPFSDRARGLSMVSTGLTLLSPGIPMLFMGQEFLENKQFDDTEAARIWWGFLDTQGGVRDFAADLCNLRTSRGSLRADSGVQIIHVNDGAEVIAFQRWDSQGDVTLAVANFSDTDFSTYNLGAPATGIWHELANSSASVYGGNGAVNGDVVAASPGMDSQPAAVTLRLAPHTLAVFSQTPLDIQEDASGLLMR